MRNNTRRPHSIAKKKFLDTLHGKIIFSSLCVLMTLAGAALITGETLLSRINHVALSSIGTGNPSPDSDGQKEDDSLLGNSDVFNLLLVGNDTRGGEKYGNSDTMLLLSINKKTNQLKMVSFLRDLYVPIEGFKERNRINASFEVGGPSLLKDTIERNFGVRIDKYACIDFKGFEKAIDTVGGVTVTLTKDEAQELNGDPETYFSGIGEKPEKVSVGTQKLDGVQALAYSRIRHLDNDFHRTQRQRNVIAALMSSMKNSNPLTLLGMANEVCPMIQTDLTTPEIEQLMLFKAPAVMKGNLQQFTVPADGAFKNGVHFQDDVRMEVLEPDIPKNRKLVQNFLYGTGDSGDSSN